MGVEETAGLCVRLEAGGGGSVAGWAVSEAGSGCEPVQPLAVKVIPV